MHLRRTDHLYQVQDGRGIVSSKESTEELEGFVDAVRPGRQRDLVAVQLRATFAVPACPDVGQSQPHS